MKLINCRHSGIGVHSCDHTEDIGIRCIGMLSHYHHLVNCILLQVSMISDASTCTDGDLRLVGGASKLEGRVEVCYNNQWGAVCDNYWTTSDATVVCKQLGFLSFGKHRYFSTNKFTVKFNVNKP